MIAKNHYRTRGLKNDGTLTLEYGVFKCDIQKSIPREAVKICKILGLPNDFINRVDKNLKDEEQ